MTSPADHLRRPRRDEGQALADWVNASGVAATFHDPQIRERWREDIHRTVHNWTNVWTTSHAETDPSR